MGSSFRAARVGSRFIPLAMGLIDRLLGKGSTDGAFSVKKPKAEKVAPSKEAGTFFLDPDAASTLGNVDYMRRPNTIRHTFPGNADNPGDKEMVQEVDSMKARVASSSPSLGEPGVSKSAKSPNSGVPKQVKKTFAEKLSASELNRRMRGSAVNANGVNTQGTGIAPRKAGSGGDEAQPKVSQQAAKPGAIDPFKSMARDIIT